MADPAIPPIPPKRLGGGSRYLYEPFDLASARVDALERVIDERWVGLERRLMEIEALLDRMELRLWLAVYGLAAVLVTEGLLIALR